MLFIKASNNVDYNDSIDKIKKKWDNAEPVNIDNDLIRKWCGMARNRIGKDWIKQCKMQGMIYIADKLHKENKRLNKEIKKLIGN